MKKADLTDEALTAAVAEMSSGLVDAELGGHVVKNEWRDPDKGSKVAQERSLPQGWLTVGFSVWVRQE